MASKQYYPKGGFSRRNDRSFFGFATSAGKKLFGLFATHFYFGASIKHAVQTLTSSGNAVAVDASLGSIWKHVLTENTTFAAPTNLENGGEYTLHLVQAAAGSKTVAFNALFKLAGGSFTMTSTANKIDTLKFWSDGTYLYETSRVQIVG